MNEIEIVQHSHLQTTATINFKLIVAVFFPIFISVPYFPLMTKTLIAPASRSTPAMTSIIG